jgi:hypothetical protein
MFVVSHRGKEISGSLNRESTKSAKSVDKDIDYEDESIDE